MGGTGKREKVETNEATKIFTNLAAEKIKNPKTQQEYVNALNRRYNLDG